MCIGSYSLIHLSCGIPYHKNIIIIIQCISSYTSFKHHVQNLLLFTVFVYVCAYCCCCGFCLFVFCFCPFLLLLLFFLLFALFVGEYNYRPHVPSVQPFLSFER